MGEQSAFGRGWIPAGRDIGLPNDAPAYGAAPPSTRFDAFTAERRALFLQHLAQHGNVRMACEAIGISPQTAYLRRRRDGLFAQGWDGALVLARDHAEQVLCDRALNGVTETIWYRGEAVGSRTRFETRLLLAHLERLDRHHANARDGKKAAARFDELLEDVLDAGEDTPVADARWEPSCEDRTMFINECRCAAMDEFPDEDDDAPYDCDAEPVSDAEYSRHLADAAQAAADRWDALAMERLVRIDALAEQGVTGAVPLASGACQLRQPAAGNALVQNTNVIDQPHAAAITAGFAEPYI